MSNYLELLAKNVPPMPKEHLLKLNSEQLRAYEKSRNERSKEQSK
jgi:hypothetical protein